MKTKSFFLLFLLPWAAGCNSGGEMSAADEAKMKAAMDPKKTDLGTMTPDQKAGFEKWKAGGGAAASASAPGAGQ